MDKYKIGIDLGGTKIESILLDPCDHELFRKRISTPSNTSNNYYSIIRSIQHLLSDTVRQLPESCEYTIGIGIPGTINKHTQLVQNANTTCLIGKPFQSDLEKLFVRKIGMENDANCFTIAESLSGIAKNHDFVFGIIMGTGCGGGISINGRIHTGKHDIAGEWGHFSVDPNGSKCYCGNLGCIETKISGKGVESTFSQTYGRALSMKDIVEGYREDNPQCKTVFEQFLDDFGRCLGGLISVIDPDAVVLGGGLSNIPELYDKGYSRVKHYAFHQSLETPLLKNQLGDSAGVIGAAWIGK